jgi:hypothetical protein
MDIDDVFPPPQRLTPERQERIRSVLLDEISPAAPGRPRRTNRRSRVLAAGVSAAAVAVAVTLAVTVPPEVRGGTPPARHPAAQQTGSQILLAAATSVAHQNPGIYWHIVINQGEPGIPGGATDTDDQWIAHDGNFWSSPPCKQGLTGKVVMHIPQGQSFGLGKASWTYDLVQHWPTNPAALKARIDTYTSSKSLRLQALTALELIVPAPPGVRAAAYRAIAMFPGVQNRGTVKGGHAVYIPARDGGPFLLVIDAATGLIHSEENPEATGEFTETVVLAQWANQLPTVLPPNKYYCSPGH